MKEKVYIGCGAGFAGDRFDASIPIVKQLLNIEAPKYLMFEVLAERTLALAQQLRIKNPEEGYSPFLDSYITPILEDCLENISNRFLLTLVAALRSRLLVNGAEPLIDMEGSRDKSSVIALKEIAAGLIGEDFLIQNPG